MLCIILPILVSSYNDRHINEGCLSQLNLFPVEYNSYFLPIVMIQCLPISTLTSFQHSSKTSMQVSSQYFNMSASSYFLPFHMLVPRP
jgi:hypothetical protein